MQAPGAWVSGAERLEMGSRVTCEDGELGELVRVIIDPVAQQLTHLVVAPKHYPGPGRLVPVSMLDTVEGNHIRLDCSAARFHELDDAEDVQFLPASTDILGYGPHALMWPYYGLGMPLSGPHHEPILADRVPLGDVEIHRGDQVHATDGWIGAVQGLVINPEDHHVTHVLLQEGHLWGRKQVVIPIGTTSHVGEIVRVALTKQQINDLPPIELSSHP
jgi:sporulation protein YlmC with PRC-barrel domain